MKKIVLIMVVLSLCAAPAFAWNFGSAAGADGESVLGKTTFKTSTLVDLYAVSTTTTYGCASKHLAGDTAFTSDHTKPDLIEIGPNDANKGVPITDEVGAGAEPKP